MPMFRPFVPAPVRPWIYVVLAFCFQFSGGVYLGAMGEMMGEWSVMREDIQMCLYCTLLGMALYFPVLFRMKFHFTNKALIMFAAATILVCNALTMHALPLPVLWVVCIVCGMMKIQGTFECMSSIQLWMTPRRDFAVFFPLLHLVLLTAIEVTGFLAAQLAYVGHWSMMHWLVMGLMLFVLLVQALLTRPWHAMPKIVPLRGIDWPGALLWAVFWVQAIWLMTYGDWLDWWAAPRFRLVTGTAALTLALCMVRTERLPKPYFEPALWRYRHAAPIILLIGLVEVLFSCEHALEAVYYGSVMHYAEHTSQLLNQWSLLGLWGGCLFTLGWLKLMRWNVYKLIAVALCVFSLYAAGFYFLVDAGLNIEALRLPLIFRGFAYAVLCIAFMWSLDEVLSFEHFFQALAVFNILHMFVGGLVGGALHAYGLKYYVADGFARYGAALDAVRLSARGVDMAALAERFASGLVAQSVKILFGWTLLAALFLAALFLLWDIPMVRTRVKRIPSWTKVGMGVWRGYQRSRRLHRLRRERRLRAAL